MSAAASGTVGLRAASGARKLARSTRLLGILFLILASYYGTDAAAIGDHALDQRRTVARQRLVRAVGDFASQTEAARFFGIVPHGAIDSAGADEIGIASPS